MSDQKNDMQKVVKILVFLLAFVASGIFGAGILLFTGGLFLSTAGAGASLLSSGIALSSEVMADIDKVVKKATAEAKIKKAQKEAQEEQEARKKAEKKEKEAKSAEEEEKPAENAPEKPIDELDQEAKKWLNAFVEENYEPISNSYKAHNGKFFSFKPESKKDEYSKNFSLAITSKDKIGNCPANSDWKIEFNCESGECANLNKIPKKCKNITPKVITNHKSEEDL